MPAPGAALASLLKQWANEPIETPKKLKDYLNELWKMRGQFEMELKDEEKGIYMLLDVLKDNYIERSTHLR